ncbi:MAG: DUF2933 domain-containing protein [Burkholderiales bacterium]|jgi:hypothetical protein|nr:DUF2933 domain-containing protein [Burkholderiales bacterium]
MEWLLENWIWIVVAAAFIGIHMFGHGGHGSHGRRDADARGAHPRGGDRPPGASGSDDQSRHIH